MSCVQDMPGWKAEHSSAAEHPIVSVIRLRAFRRVLWMRETWGKLPAVVHPAAIQDQEIDRILICPDEDRRKEGDFYTRNPEAAGTEQGLLLAEARLAGDPRWQNSQAASTLQHLMKGSLRSP